MVGADVLMAVSLLPSGARAVVLVVTLAVADTAAGGRVLGYASAAKALSPVTPHVTVAGAQRLDVAVRAHRPLGVVPHPGGQILDRLDRAREVRNALLERVRTAARAQDLEALDLADRRLWIYARCRLRVAHCGRIENRQALCLLCGWGWADEERAPGAMALALFTAETPDADPHTHIPKLGIPLIRPIARPIHDVPSDS